MWEGVSSVCGRGLISSESGITPHETMPRKPRIEIQKERQMNKLSLGDCNIAFNRGYAKEVCDLTVSASSLDRTILSTNTHVVLDLGRTLF